MQGIWWRQQGAGKDEFVSAVLQMHTGKVGGGGGEYYNGCNEKHGPFCPDPFLPPPPTEGQQAGIRLLSAGQCETSTDGQAWAPERERACAHVRAASVPTTAHRAFLQDLCMLCPSP